MAFYIKSFVFILVLLQDTELQRACDAILRELKT
ncbi:hypothetical protein PAQU9191_00352 [Photobacterium aquimaris]|uniref:Uncharacterized protein n=1 Tax=Photobacterium aquimaris TaxID=512643 RepID=A0A1Y6KSV6_9GAMM|nr:hypothetical protein PAQU9191_00352 [Photobacterium aquimaris]